MYVQILPLKSFDVAKDKVTLKNMLVGHQHFINNKENGFDFVNNPRFI